MAIEKNPKNSKFTFMDDQVTVTPPAQEATQGKGPENNALSMYLFQKQMNGKMRIKKNRNTGK